MNVVNFGYGVKERIKMQEVFEKIKKVLEREVLGKPTPQEYDEAIYKAIKTVNEVAKEYNNGERKNQNGNN